ncbi:hypothetical protein [Gorillibacterium timonense]|uniref:hypothetical protein n=1 Tax=Gorillibacterium timonense TaxID=1689269 RepID=UPI00071C20C4|nr:hypothetical protein [Gorillibacterium timonense]
MAKISKIVGKAATVLSLASTVEDFYQANTYKYYEVDKYIGEFLFIQADSKGELLAKYLYARESMLLLMKEGKVERGRNKYGVTWAWDKDAIKQLREEIDRIKK